MNILWHYFRLEEYPRTVVTSCPPSPFSSTILHVHRDIPCAFLARRTFVRDSDRLELFADIGVTKVPGWFILFSIRNIVRFIFQGVPLLLNEISGLELIRIYNYELKLIPSLFLTRGEFVDRSDN